MSSLSANTPPSWFTPQEQCERKKVDYTIITRKQSLNLPRKLLFLLQNILRKIYDNCITSVDMTALELGNYGVLGIASSLEKTRSLTYLNLTNTQMGDFGAARLAVALAKNASLTSLICGNRQITTNSHQHNVIGNIGVKALSQSLIGHPSLTHFEISSNRITDVGMRHLADALENEDCYNICALAVRSKKIANINRVIDSFYFTPSCILELNLSNCSIGDTGCEALSELLLSRNSRQPRINESSSAPHYAIRDPPLHPHGSCVLQYLDLTGNDFSDAAVPSLCNMIVHSSLSNLILRSTSWMKGFGDGLSQLLDSFQKHTIREGQNPIQLKLLDLRGHEIGEQLEMELWHCNEGTCVLTGEH